MTIAFEQNRGQARPPRPRVSDLGAVPTDSDRRRDRDARGRFADGNKAGAGRGARKAIAGTLRQARAAVRKALRENVAPTIADQILTDALNVYLSSTRDLGSRSILVHAPSLRFGVNTILAGHFTNLAVIAGLHTKRGAALLSMAHACENRAERAEAVAIAASKAVAERRTPSDADVPWMVNAAPTRLAKGRASTPASGEAIEEADASYRRPGGPTNPEEP